MQSKNVNYLISLTVKVNGIIIHIMFSLPASLFFSFQYCSSDLIVTAFKFLLALPFPQSSFPVCRILLHWMHIASVSGENGFPSNPAGAGLWMILSSHKGQGSPLPPPTQHPKKWRIVPIGYVAQLGMSISNPWVWNGLCSQAFSMYLGENFLVVAVFLGRSLFKYMHACCTRFTGNHYVRHAYSFIIFQ